MFNADNGNRQSVPVPAKTAKILAQVSAQTEFRVRVEEELLARQLGGTQRHCSELNALLSRISRRKQP